MRKCDGKVRFTSVLIIAAVIYGAFISFKYISISMQQTQIEKEVGDMLGNHRGADFTAEKGVAVINEMLGKRSDILYDAEVEGSAEVTIDRKKNVIFFSFTYEVEIDGIFFKDYKVIEAGGDLHRF